MAKQKLEVLIAAPASGKSTYAKEKIKNDLTWKRVNKDDIRIELGIDSFSKANEKKVVEHEDRLIIEYIEAGFNVIVDDTNLNPFHLNERFKPLAKLKDLELIVNKEFMKVPMETCIERDKNREASVGEAVIKNMFKMYSKWEREPYWLEEIVKVRTKLPDAFIFDLDGTLAFANGRSWYEEEKCESDIVNVPVSNVLISLMKSGINVVFVSGRQDKAMIQTTNWLNYVIRRGFDGDFDIELYMRATGDTRSDVIVKEEIYNNNIKNKYCVLGVFDDRKSVVEGWKKMGLFVFDCNQSGADF